MIDVYGAMPYKTAHFYFIDGLSAFDFMIFKEGSRYDIASFNFKRITKNELEEDLTDRGDEKPFFIIDSMMLSDFEFFKTYSSLITGEMCDAESDEFLMKYPEYNDFYFLGDDLYIDNEKVDLDYENLEFRDNFGMFKLFIPIVRGLYSSN